MLVLPVNLTKDELASAIKAQFITSTKSLKEVCDDNNLTASEYSRINRIKKKEGWVQGSLDTDQDLLTDIVGEMSEISPDQKRLVLASIKQELMENDPTLTEQDASAVVDGVLDEVDGLAALDKAMQKQAHAIIEAIDEKLTKDCSLTELKVATQINTALRSAYFPAKAAAINIMNNNVNSEKLTLFKSRKVDDA